MKNLAEIAVAKRIFIPESHSQSEPCPITVSFVSKIQDLMSVVSIEGPGLYPIFWRSRTLSQSAPRPVLVFYYQYWRSRTSPQQNPKKKMAVAYPMRILEYWVTLPYQRSRTSLYQFSVSKVQDLIPSVITIESQGTHPSFQKSLWPCVKESPALYRVEPNPLQSLILYLISNGGPGPHLISVFQ